MSAATIRSILEGALSGPLSENVQGRLAFIINQDDGWMESIVPGVSDRGGNDHYALRGTLAWQPSDETDVNLIVRYLKADGETPGRAIFPRTRLPERAEPG